MSFMVQFRLGDRPSSEADDGLVAIHHCLRCHDARIDGCGELGTDYHFPGYDVRVFPATSGIQADGLGVVARELEPWRATLTRAEEVMTAEDAREVGIPHDPVPADIPFSVEDDYPIFPEEYTELGFPDFGNRGGNKIGGWPSWGGATGLNACPHGGALEFGAQFAYRIFRDGVVAPGGAGYIWVCPPACQARLGELVLVY